MGRVVVAVVGVRVEHAGGALGEEACHGLGGVGAVKGESEGASHYYLYNIYICVVEIGLRNKISILLRK